ncbi:NACHT, LRR and PYD domains-containing protein 3-like isoform X2 [Halichondria panicea]|uniref:NACHT, LRR and PYD domains-containing protein 3-like isoform X2 n=1 Tax=Halichondria panicea TaxID=6063 RepID=UPI00312B450C
MFWTRSSRHSQNQYSLGFATRFSELQKSIQTLLYKQKFKHRIRMDRFIASIRRKYEERLLNREEQWPPVRGDRLINLQLVEAEKEEGFRAGLPQHGTPDDKVKRTPILHDNLFKVEEGRKPVKKLIVEGNAGIGKTTLCTMLAEGWAEGKILTRFDCVLLFPLRENRVSSATSLAKLFKLLHSSKKIRASVIEELEEREGDGVLILADGWDELSVENRSKISFLYDLLFGDVLPFASVLLTSRPSASAPLHDLPSVDRLIEVVGFNEDNIRQYIVSEFEQFQEKASSLIEQLENNPVIQSVCSVPLNCAIVCNLWHTLDQELPRTLTELYTQIVLSIIFRNAKKKLSDCLSLSSFDKIPTDLQDTFWLICEFAYKCLLLDQLVFSEAELSSHLPEVGDKLHCFGLLQSARSLLLVGHGLSFHFAHLTIQEFLAALHLATLPNEEKLKVVEAHAMSRRFDTVWRFMFGLASSCSDKVIRLDDSLMDKFLFLMVKEFRKLLLCLVAFEASDPKFSTKVCKMCREKLSLNNNILDNDFIPFEQRKFDSRIHCVARLYVLRHAAQFDDMVIEIHDFVIDDKLLKELTDILCNANGKLQVRSVIFKEIKLSEEGVADLFKRASVAFTALDYLLLCGSNFSNIMSSFMHTSCTSLTQLHLSHNLLGVSGIQSLETAVQYGTLINLKDLELSNTLTEDADVNGALLTTLLQSIASHCPDLRILYLSKNTLGLPGLCSVVENIPLVLNEVYLWNTHPTTSFHSEPQYAVTCEMLNLHPNCLTTMDLHSSNFRGTAGTLLLAKFLQAFQSLERLDCSNCSLTSADIIMLIHHLKSNNVICKNLHWLNLRANSIVGVMALTECLPELFPRLDNFNFSDLSGVLLHGNPVSIRLINMCNEQLKASKELREAAVLNEGERMCLPPQNEEINHILRSWDTLLSEMIDIFMDMCSPSSIYLDNLLYDDDNDPVEHHPIDEVVDTVDTPSDVTDPDTLINEQSFSQVSPVEHHPTASDEATCTTALQSTHGTDQHTTAHTEIPSDITELGDTSQDVHTSYPHTITSGAGGPRTVTIEELKERTKVTDSQLDTEIKETDMIVLAAHFDNVETYPVQLGLNPAEHQTVRSLSLQYDIQTAMDKALRLWRQHNPGAATYRALVMILLRIGKEALAYDICQSAANV